MHYEISTNEINAVDTFVFSFSMKIMWLQQTNFKINKKKHKFEALAGPYLDKKCLAFGQSYQGQQMVFKQTLYMTTQNIL